MPNTMSAVQDVLRREREAAVRADVDQLLELQTQKAELFGMLASEVTADDPAYLRACREAGENVQLMRHLVKCLSTITGRDRQNYTPRGSTSAHPPSLLGRSRGHL